MEQNKLQSIAESFCLFIPLLKKKLIRTDLHSDDIGLSPSHFQILFLLSEMGTITVSTLANGLNISKPNITPLIQKLVRMGFVERVNSEEDRRYAHIGLSEAGRLFIEQHKVLITEDLKRKLSGFSDQDLDKFAKSLEVLKDIISRI